MEAVQVGVRAHAHRTFHQIVWAGIPKCGARTRSGRPCLGLIVRGKKRCRMHGGGKNSGGQLGNRNRCRHGRFSRDAVEGRALMRLSSALNSLVDANLAVIAAVARGDDQKQYERLTASIEAKRDAAVTAAANYQRFLTQVGREDEAAALTLDLAAVIEPAAPAATFAAAPAAG